MMKFCAVSFNRGSKILSNLDSEIHGSSALFLLRETLDLVETETTVESDSNEDIKLAKDSPVVRRGLLSHGLLIRVNKTTSIAWIVSALCFFFLVAFRASSELTKNLSHTIRPFRTYTRAVR